MALARPAPRCGARGWSHAGSTRASRTPGAGDFVYIDPPYHRLTAGSFTSYTVEGFGEREQRELAAVVGSAARGRVPRDGQQLGHAARPRAVPARTASIPIRAARAINSAPGGRGPVDEVLVLNY